MGRLQVTHRDAPESEWRKWLWASQGDIFMRGAFFVESGDQSGVLRLRGLVKPQPARTVKSLTRFTGVIGGCRPGIPC
ncbi:pectate lyase [Sarracenia purpurea var. burkii]